MSDVAVGLLIKSEGVCGVVNAATNQLVAIKAGSKIFSDNGTQLGEGSLRDFASGLGLTEVRYGKPTPDHVAVLQKIAREKGNYKQLLERKLEHGRPARVRDHFEEQTLQLLQMKYSTEERGRFLVYIVPDDENAQSYACYDVAGNFRPFMQPNTGMKQGGRNKWAAKLLSDEFDKVYKQLKHQFEEIGKSIAPEATNS